MASINAVFTIIHVMLDLSFKLNYSSHCFVLTLVGAKHKSDFQVHLDIQNLMLVLISNLHKFNKTLVHFANKSAILRWYHFWLDILSYIVEKRHKNTYFWKIAWLLVKLIKDMMNLFKCYEKTCLTFQISRWTWEIWVFHPQVSKQNSVTQWYKETF